MIIQTHTKNLEQLQLSLLSIRPSYIVSHEYEIPLKCLAHFLHIPLYHSFLIVLLYLV